MTEKEFFAGKTFTIKDSPFPDKFQYRKPSESVKDLPGSIIKINAECRTHTATIDEFTPKGFHFYTFLLGNHVAGFVSFEDLIIVT